MESDKFDRETIDKYLEILVKKYPKVDDYGTFKENCSEDSRYFKLL